MVITRRHLTAPIALIAPILAAGPLLAQEVPAILGPPTLQFSFSNPGARSAGFGGAFVALADDATAAFANPAGLVQITRSEVSLEGRYWSYSTAFTERGRLEGRPTGIGVDVVDGLQGARSPYDTTGVSYLSFVYPKDRWSIAVYRHQLADFQSLTRTQGFFSGSGTECCRLVDYRTRTDLEIGGYGLSGGYRVNDALSVGLSLVHFDGELDIVTDPFIPDPAETVVIFAPTSYLPDRRVARTIFRIDTSDWGLTGGFLWTLSPRWRLAGFYRQGPDLELGGESTSGPAGAFFGLPPDGTLLESFTTPISFPDVYGLGCAFRPLDGRLTISFEWDRVEYSTILDSLDPRVIDVGEFVLDDGNEYRLGAEYVFIRSTPLTATRVGVWLDPDHRPGYSGVDPLTRAVLRPGDDEMHFAVGIGLAFESFQLDFAADFSEPVDTVSLSAIYSL